MERELFTLIAQGDEKAFREIFDLYKSKLYQFVFKLTNSKAISEEIIQDVFLGIWLGRQKLGTVIQPENYIFILTRNKTMDYLRKIARDKKKITELYLSTSILGGYKATETDQHLKAKNLQALIENAISLLPERKQVIFHLSRNEDLSNEEISERLHISKSRVAHVIVEVLKYLRDYLQKHDIVLLPLLILLLKRIE